MAESPIPVVDWCARAARLQEFEMAILTNDVTIEARFGQDMQRWGLTANLKDVRAALETAMRNCRAAHGEIARRTRYALPGRMTRPY